ncbi:MAG: ECF transporter S component [Xylanivirga thermophila]|jgi:energy-coupling factor transport system substrate-specific component|uniref:ECF transporter S component n=1 Tax=Xylanivirga thermophila TaxID=2496273 RepID=UPI00101C3259|nr:ECF transporter S component [Xylanivirga thermophila]
MNSRTWSFISLFVIGLSIGGFFILYEKRRMSPKEIALVANLSALAGLGRVPFAAIPSVQPTSFLVIISGYVFGPVTGFAVGALAAVSSNIFLGQGPWTLWQMICWGLMGVTGGMYKRIGGRGDRFTLSVIGAIWGYLFGWIMNIWHWVTFVYPLNLKSFIATYASSFWFDTLHALGNVIFLYYLGPDVINVLERYKRRLKVYEIPPESLDKR